MLSRLYAWRAREVWTWLTTDLVISGTSAGPEVSARMEEEEAQMSKRRVTVQATVCLHEAPERLEDRTDAGVATLSPTTTPG